MLVRSVFIEYRPPKDKHEAKVYGRTHIDRQGTIAKVFINSSRRRDGEALNTFFHEMTHVWNALMWDGKATRKKDEAGAQVIGDVVETLFKELFGRK